MAQTHLPVILIELVLVAGGVLAFGWWQLRSVARDRRDAATKRAKAESVAQAESSDAQGKPVDKQLP
jgi:predicted negative regulator of RcsB-dependent stress response